jgi:hypothetical protein
LAPGCGPLLDLQRRTRRRLSLVNGDADLHRTLTLADAPQVLRAIGRSPD